MRPDPSPPGEARGASAAAGGPPPYRGAPVGLARRHVFTLAGLALVAFALSQADLRGAARTLAAVGPLAVFAAVAAYALETLVDVRAWRLVGARVGRPLPLGGTIATRLGLEAIAYTAPGGALTADVAGPFVLRRSVDVPLAESVSIVLIRKWGILAGHALLLALAAALGAPFLARASRALGGEVDLGVALAVSAAVVALAAVVARALLRRGTAERVGRALARIPWYRLRRVVALRAAGLLRADATTSAFFDARRAGAARLVALSLALWLLESAEAFLLLTLLGARPAFVDVLAIEATLTVVRTIAFFLPAGLGVRELGHLALVLLVAGGTPEIAAAYAILRRGLELLYAFVGVGVSHRGARAEAPT